MIKNRGFTLIELLGVLVILALLSIIIVPTVTSTIKSGEIKADEQLKSNIILATKNWALDNKDKLPKTSGEKKTVTLIELQNGGYLDRNIKKPSNGTSLTNICVYITNTGTTSQNNNKYNNNKYKYEYSENC